MKKTIYIIVSIVAIASIISLFPKSQAPYSGTYYANNPNIELALNSNNSFDIYIGNDKRNIIINGKYKIFNNHIELMTNDKYDMFFIKDISSGEITGSIITFKHVKNSSSTIFTKS